MEPQDKAPWSVDPKLVDEFLRRTEQSARLQRAFSPWRFFLISLGVCALIAAAVVAYLSTLDCADVVLVDAATKASKISSVCR